MGHLMILLHLCIMSVVMTEARTQLNWRSRASTLLCNHPGSRSDKALKIRKELHSTYPDWSWYVSVMDDDVSWSSDHDRSSTEEQWKHVCGYNMFIWYKEDSKIDKRPCSSVDTSIVEDIIRTADSQGYSSSDVRFDINRLMREYGIGFHLISVDDGNRHSSHASQLTSTGCSVAKNANHDVFVYLK